MQNTTPTTQNNQPVANNSMPGTYPQMADFSQRLIAIIVDSLILGVASSIIGGIFGTIFTASAVMAVSSNDPYAMFSYPAFAISSILGLVIGVLYYGYFYTTTGQTPGKKIVNIKVVNTNLQNIGWGTTFLREYVGKFISGIVLYLGYSWYFIDEKRQTWHDKISSTYVVKVDQTGQVLMDGPASYKSEPVKALVPCGCYFLFLVAIFAFFIILIGTLGFNTNSNSTDYNNNSVQENIIPTFGAPIDESI